MILISKKKNIARTFIILGVELITELWVFFVIFGHIQILFFDKAGVTFHVLSKPVHLSNPSIV